MPLPAGTRLVVIDMHRQNPVYFREPAVAGQASPLKHFEGKIARAQDQNVTVQLPGGAEVTFPVDQVDRANLKFEW